MNARIRFVIALGVLGLLMTGPFVLTALILVADANEAERKVLEEVLLPRLPLGALITIFGFILGVALLRTLFRQYVNGLMGMAELLRLMLGANRNFRVAVEGPPEVAELARAANDLAQQRDDLMADVEAQVRQAKAGIEEEKHRLAALVADLPQPVIVCNLDGRILLYNNRARLQARALAPDAHASGAVIGLGRSIYTVFDRGMIAHALENLQHRLDRQGSQPLAHFVTASRAGQLIRVQMAPVLAVAPDGGASAITGYVMTLENISRYLDSGNQCDLLMHQISEQGLAALAGIRGSLRELREAGGTAVLDALEGQVAALTAQMNDAARRYAESMRTRWPLEEMRGDDLIAAAQRRIESELGIQVRLDAVEPALWVKVDSYSLVQAMTFLAARLAEDYDVRLVRLRMESAEGMVHLDMLWQGTAISSELLVGWQLEPMSFGGETCPLTLRDVVDRHGGTISCGRETAIQQSLFRVLIPVAVAQEGSDSTELLRVESRPEFYDFDLFHRSGEDRALDDRLLSELVYTAFDTETTGLEPSAGDEIIQFGAVRIVNGRLLRHESFEQFVDPRRKLRPGSIPIHGITQDMLAGKPTIDRVLPQFHQFCEETVLVAHNAAFDMRFLQLKEEATGVRFTQPVLDTLLLSAVVHPNQESHKLEAIAERLGIPIIGRHNALGDAIVTAEVFLRLLALLDGMGIRTLGEAREAAEKTYYARIKY